jgi:DNA mismatch repair ATPase MutS
VQLLSIPREPPGKRPVLRPVYKRNPDVVEVDEGTLGDLEVFRAGDGGLSLFDLCNQTRTLGGAKVLRSRMRRPWRNPERIRRVQESLRHMQAHRGAFEGLPGDGATEGVDRYFHSGLPLLTTKNRVEFVVESLEVRFGETHRYWRIREGVWRTAGMVYALQRMVARPELAQAPGELGPWLEEMRALLARPVFGQLPREGDREMPCWRLLGIDRLLRLDERVVIERLLRLIFEMDALLSMADAMTRYDFVLPELVEGPLSVDADGLFLPFVKDPVRNPLQLDQQRRLLFLTGPNMAGKTTYLRACGTALYLAHLGMGVPASRFRFTPCDSFFSAITTTDNVRAGVSYFRAEALRVKAIAEAVSAGRRVIALMDEPFKGTNVKDALDASRAVLVRLAEKPDCLFMVSSHLIELGAAMDESGQVDCRRFEAAEEGGRLEFDYVLRLGVSTQRLGVRVLAEEGVFQLLDSAGRS